MSRANGVMIELLNDAKFFIVCDLETTGVDVHKCDWITGSFSRIRISDFCTESELELKSRPVNHWDEEARYIHRIPRHKAMEFPERAAALESLTSWLPPRSEFVFVCHANPRPFNFAVKNHTNTHFDFAALKWDFFMQNRLFDFYKFFDNHKILSTKTLANDFFGLSPELNLKEVCANLSIPMIGEHHDAQADRKACEQILRKYLNEIGFYSIGDRGSKLDSPILDVQENSSLAQQQRFNF